ncbi:heparan-alpha-glucosaminide N-acetyltransferase domain-containing protein [Piscinibacter sp. XHJ-5]|uniref:acyltransferase family protein n=1 Tax=Piscinibacter sp. XHJ-5 TaxID=3037797 RepID=UPI002452AE33|nr:heparan-alpha-glucosaminide N-acetyltransferase domain-containing protein [Piscinibacter sp. XHJ-5]
MRDRLASVDALRGLTVAAMLLVNDPGDWGHLFAPLQHAVWHGCTPTDLVFPFFLFLVGVSLSLSLGPRVEAGADAVALRRSVLVRALRIVLLGLLLHAVAHWLLDTRAFRPMGVLQRIGLCFAAGGMLVIHTKPRTQWAMFLALLVGYTLAMAWGGPLTKEGNLASRIDGALLGRFAYEFDAVTGRGHEPEGLLSTLPAIATTLLGVRAGDWLRRGRLRAIVGAAVAALAAGVLASLVVPLNKQLWTSSFVLWTGGWALAALAVAHVAIDRRGAPAIGRRFGVNAIAAYAGSWLMACLLAAWGWQGPIYAHGFAWMTPLAGPQLPSLAYALAFVGVWWAIVALLDQRRIHIKI